LNAAGLKEYDLENMWGGGGGFIYSTIASFVWNDRKHPQKIIKIATFRAEIQMWHLSNTGQTLPRSVAPLQVHRMSVSGDDKGGCGGAREITVPAFW
jgi:hypothetical protein